jgi:hypothetical protein
MLGHEGHSKEHTMHRYIMACVGALLLAGCTTPEQKAASMQAEMDRMMLVYGPACVKLGYPSNTDQWRNCVLHLSAKDDADRYYPHYYAGFGRSRWSMGGFWGPYW